MKNKIYKLAKQMQQDGWTLITLSKYQYKNLNCICWHAQLTKDDISAYIEIEEERMGMINVDLECPKCGKEPSNDINEGDFCPDCEVAWDYKKEIPADYK